VSPPLTPPVVAPFDICGPLPTGTTLLEASAGTGKTWTIAALVTRYVAEGVVRLDQMLVVTFGRAASQELRERVREQLVEAERSLAGRLSEGPLPSAGTTAVGALLALLLDADDVELARRLRRVRLALSDFDAATIATHQFCQLVLKSLGVAGDTDTGATLVEDLDDLLVEVVDDIYVRGFAGDPAPPIFDRSDALKRARAAAVVDPQAALEPAATDPKSLAGRRRGFGQAVREEMDRRKRRLGLLSYDDLLSQLAEALAEPDSPARQRMRQRWAVVLVDEFQDTDPVQWSVLDRAFSGHAALVLIGDPKQAVYAFRGGDVVAYLKAAETASTHATLGTNHRSDAPLVASIQALLEGAALGDDRIVVRPVTARQTGSRLVGAPHPAPFRLRLVDRARFGKVGAKGVTIGRLRQHVATDLARDVKALLAAGASFDDRPLQPRDIAVLCATRTQCAAVFDGLAAEGIKAVVAGGGSVFVTEAAAQWLCVLEAMEQPHRSGRVRAAALTGFFGCTATELDQGGEAITDATAETLRDWSDLFRERGVGAVFEAASTSGSLARRVLSEVDGDRLMTDLRHAGEALNDAASRDGLGLVALVTWLRAQMADDKVEVSTERTRRLDSDAAAVQILTIHASKGLQFPVVYLPGVSDSYPYPVDLPRFHDADGRRCLDIGGVTGPHQQAAATEDSGEQLRLLYVALTRAQSQVVTWWVPSLRNTPGSSLHRVIFGRRPGVAAVPASVPLRDDPDTLAWARDWEAAGGPTVEAAEWSPVRVLDRQEDQLDLRVREFTRQVDRSWRRASYTSLSSAALAAPQPTATLPSSEPEDPPRDDETNFVAAVGADHPLAATGIRSPMADLPVGATFGSLVHAVLEHADPQAAERGGDLHAEMLHHIRQQLVRWPVALDPAALADALVAVCDSPLGPLVGGATLRQVGRADRMCELSFELPLARGDDRTRPVGRATLRDLAAALRRHLPDDDPLRPYADVVDDPAYDLQVLAGYLTGSLDVVLRAGGRFVVADYKTNWLGDADADLTADDYRPAALRAAMNHSTYPLQALLYAVVLHRFLRWRLPGYLPEAHFGGVVYLYLRGMCGPDTPLVDGRPCGVFAWAPPVALVLEVSDLLDGIPWPST